MIALLAPENLTYEKIYTLKMEDLRAKCIYFDFKNYTSQVSNFNIFMWVFSEDSFIIYIWSTLTIWCDVFRCLGLLSAPG